MNKFPLDLSKFKRISSTPSETTLQHVDGHKFVINHSALDRKNLDSLSGLPLLSQENKLPSKRMADGGMAEPAPQPSGPEEPPASDVPPPPEPVAAQAEAASPAEETPEESSTEEAPKPAAQAPQAAIPETPPQNQASSAASDGAAAFSQDKGNNIGLIAQEDAALAHDLYQGHIHPKTYGDLVGSKDTLGKVGSVFGLLVGGLGSGLTGKENPVIAMWNHQITNDLEAQKANISNKQTLLSLNRQRFPDMESAMNFTRMQENRVFLHHLSEQVQALPPGSPSRMKAEQALASVGQFVNTENYNLSDQIASKQAFINTIQGQANGPESSFQAQQNMLRRGNRDQQNLANENESHHAAGLSGQSSVSLTPENRNTLQSKALLDHKLDDFIDFAKKNSGSLNPKVIAQGKALAADLNTAWRNGNHGGVYKEGENEFINTMIDANPTKFANNLRGVVPKAMELKRSNMDSLNSYKSSLGFPVQKSAAPQPTPQAQSSQGEILRRDPKSGRIAVFGSNKQFIRWQ